MANDLDVFTVVSNLFLLIPFITAVRKRRVLRYLILITEVFASGLYHLCDSFDICLFDFTSHHHLDFFFAQSLIILAAFYFVEFGFGYEWLEWVLIFVGLCVIVILQITLPGELYVQAGIAVLAFCVVAGYWILFGMPEYDWNNVAIGVCLLSMSVMLFSAQQVYSPAYWAIHSLWHIVAAIGIDFIWRIKPKAFAFQAAANRIKFIPIKHRPSIIMPSA